MREHWIAAKNGEDYMTNFEKIHNMNIDELSEWLDKYGIFDGGPWIEWFNKTYCNNCEEIMCHYEGFQEREFPCSYCELEYHCRYFPDMNDTPNNKDMIKMWLTMEV